MARIGEEMVLELRATDPDGGSLAFSFRSDLPGLDQSAELSQVPGGAIFRWTPEADDAGDWFIDFFVTDGDLNDQITVPLTVEHATGEPPRFLRPAASGEVFDIAEEDPCLEVDVEIDAPAVTEVEIAQEPPLIEGAELSQIGSFEAVWSWCPSGAQLEESDRYELALSADDGVHAPAIKDYLLLLEESADALWVEAL